MAETTNAHRIDLETRSSAEWVDAGEDGVASCRMLERPTNVKWNQVLSIGSNLLVELERLQDSVVSNFGIGK